MMLAKMLYDQKIENKKLNEECVRLKMLAIDVCDIFVAPDMYRQARDFLETPPLTAEDINEAFFGDIPPKEQSK